MPLVSHDPLFQKLLNEYLSGLKAAVLMKKKRIAQMPKKIFDGIMHSFRSNLTQYNKKVEDLHTEAKQLVRTAIRGPHIQILVETDEIRKAKKLNTPTLIRGKAVFSELNTLHLTLKIDCFISFGNWHQLGDLKGYNINLIDYLDRLLPSRQTKAPDKQGIIGLVTFQNGMANNVTEFKKIATNVFNEFPEGVLCIGLHNPTYGFGPLDMIRFKMEQLLNPKGVYSLSQLFKTLADKIPAINPDMLWAHFAHSEGGLIANSVIDILHDDPYKDTKKFIEKHLLVYTYGPVKPVPKNHVLDALNTYSNRDVALFYGVKYLKSPLNLITQKDFESTLTINKKTYVIQVVDRKSNLPEVLDVKLEEPPILTLEERLNMSMFQWFAHIEKYEGAHLSKQLGDKIQDSVNIAYYPVHDHAFGQDTYKAALQKNITTLRNTYHVFTPTKK